MSFTANSKNSFISRLGATLICALAFSAHAQDTSLPSTESQPLGEQPKREKKSLQVAGKKEKKKAEEVSHLWPDWKPLSFRFDFRPVLGFQYSNDSQSKTSVAQGELGAYLGLRGVSLVEGNPGFQIEPAIGYAVGRAVVNQPGNVIESGNYRRVWGGIQTPIYYRFIRQVFATRYGVVSGGPLETSKRLMLQSDTGLAILPRVSGHYTLTSESSYGKDSSSPTLNSLDHWLHASLSSEVMSFFVDLGPGFAHSTLTQSDASKKTETKTSETYFLALSGFDLLSDWIGLEAQAKYVFSSQAEQTVFYKGRSPIDDLGGDSRRVGLPADSFHASAFFGVRRILGGLGLGWRYNLEILNVNERNNAKQEKTESNGIGVFASVRF